jgi:hypothetical protein
MLLNLRNLVGCTQMTDKLEVRHPRGKTKENQGQNWEGTSARPDFKS